MHITPHPGANISNLYMALEQVRMGAQNLVRGTDPKQYLRDYHQWAIESYRKLRAQIDAEDISRLVMTKRYVLLLTEPGSISEATRLADIAALELDERVATLEAACAELVRERARWKRSGTFVMPDTNVYLHHSNSIRHIDYAAAIGIPASPVHVVVPLVVVDELDRLKRTGARSRARVTLAVLSRELTEPDSVGRLREVADLAQPSPPVGHPDDTIELLFDPPGHVRHARADDEIVASALVVETWIGRKIKLVTSDLGMVLRARAAGLDVVALSTPDGDPS
ncbi:PIN domain-containing protein [Crossiella sp. SN42]|uniref:PIN domain-containing protein n=1 Tax=Crossiella sp. SN42 TaxID=2944808 RepID=UPI00207C7F81|nr:PIN domain-containing protein [Crossiella sp. SN42]MCO1582139.1 PIN domain-containing protein [Crossiella sp. SN42]